MNIENITKEDLELVGSLVNPDNEREQRYKFTLEYQQDILSMLLMDRVFLIQSIQLVNPAYFSDRSHSTICSILFDYFNKYNQMPTKNFIKNEIKSRFPDDDKKRIVYCGELEALIASFVSGIESRESCLDRITEFAKEQALRSAVMDSLTELQKSSKDKWLKIEDLFKSALQLNRNFEIGLDYFQTAEDRYERMRQQNISKEVFITGFPSIDDGLACGGVCRGEIAAFMGMPGTGKSLLLVKAGVMNIIRNKKVLYLTLEMDEDKIAKRFDAQLARENIRTLLENKDAIISSLREYVKDEEDKRRLIIKQFPAGTADMHTIKAYLAQMALHGWKPDMICVDYVGEFKDQDGIKTYESRQRIVRDLRALAVEEKLAVFTAFQPNRRGREAQDNNGVIDDDMLGDSFGQARPCDQIWSINQNQSEKAQGIGRIFVVKHRDGKSRYSIFFKQDKDTLDIVEISAIVHGEKMSEWSKKKSESTEDQLQKVFVKKPFKPNG